MKFVVMYVAVEDENLDGFLEEFSAATDFAEEGFGPLVEGYSVYGVTDDRPSRYADGGRRQMVWTETAAEYRNKEV